MSLSKSHYAFDASQSTDEESQVGYLRGRGVSIAAGYIVGTFPEEVSSVASSPEQLTCYQKTCHN